MLTSLLPIPRAGADRSLRRYSPSAYTGKPPPAEAPGSRETRIPRLPSTRELQRLLHGPQAGQDLLGLLAAARGGLSGPDLEELTGIPLRDIEEILHTVAGRTFTRRVSRWSSGTRPEMYLLGHEELQGAASRYLSRRLAGYHDRLHGWAGTYRARGWPPGTPEYLLSGYFRLLATLGDLPRIIACAGDMTRHDRMLDVTGGNTAALAEARTALDLIAAQDTPDLASALGLAYHRDQLTDRNTNIPTSLPAVWATLGQVTRAEPAHKYLAEVAEWLTRTGVHIDGEARIQGTEGSRRSPGMSRSSQRACARVRAAPQSVAPGTGKGFTSVEPLQSCNWRTW